MRFHTLKLLHRPLIQLHCFSKVDVGCFQRFANLFLILRQRRDAKDARLELIPRNGMKRVLLGQLNKLVLGHVVLSLQIAEHLPVVVGAFAHFNPVDPVVLAVPRRQSLP